MWSLEYPKAMGLILGIFSDWIKMQYRSEPYMIVSMIALHEKDRHRIQIVKVL
jgi:hypothetical protein